MNESDAQAITDFMQRLWPKWKPDDEELASWMRLLTKTYSPDRAREALLRLKDTTDWLGPKRAQLLHIMAGTSSEPRHTARHDGSCGMWVQCVEHPDPGHVGEFRTIYFRTDQTDQDMPDEPTQTRLMEAFRAEQQALYGGEWQLVQAFLDPVTEADMLRRRAELRPPPARPSGPLSKLMATIMTSIDKAESGNRQDAAKGAVGDFMKRQKPLHTGPPTGDEL